MTVKTLIKVADRCEEILFPLSFHCILGLTTIAKIGKAFKIAGRNNLFNAALSNRLVNTNVLDAEFARKFFKNSVEQFRFFRIVVIELPLVPNIQLMGTTERAHALGQLFLNTGSKILSFWNVLFKISLFATAALIVSTSIKKTLLGKDYSWKKWNELWEKYLTTLKIHWAVGACLVLLTCRIPIYKDR